MNPRIIAAPMAGITDAAYRTLLTDADMVCSEMISAQALVYHSPGTEPLLAASESGPPLSMQIFGHAPEVMSEAIPMLEELADYAVLDINMGCPVPKIVRNGDGSALMRDPELAGRIADACVRASQRPVTVKIRAGFDSVNAPEVARILEANGVTSITVHARTREQYYSGEADWDVISQVVEAVDIPVVGNGDVTCAEDVLRMHEQTGCDGVMIGRALRGNPWLMTDIKHYMRTGTHMQAPTIEERIEVIHRHADLLVRLRGEYIAVREMRKHVAWYTAGMRGASEVRRAVNGAETIDQLYDLIDALDAP